MLGWLRRRGTRNLGRRGEQLAARHLRREGYRILARNLRSRLGEIDLVARAPDRRTLVIVEVKAGRPGPLPPEVHVNAAKQRKLTALAADLIRRHRLTDAPVRFDVIAVVVAETGDPAIRHHRNAFTATV
jgi:putative endonuclease